MIQQHFKNFASKAIHAGQDPDPTTGAVIPPISLATTFKQKSPGVHQGFEYSRSGNPTRLAFETAIAAVENAKHGLAFASGLAASTTLGHLLKPGQHVVSVNDVYGGTNRYFTKILKPMGILIDFVDMCDLENLKNAIRPETKMVWIESPTNPTLTIIDIRGAAEIVRSFDGVLLVVDNTFMSPYFQNPLDLGADVVLHSVTKYINGHSDVVGGVLATSNTELFERLRYLQNALGGVPAPFDCYLAHRGLKTLHVRMREHERNAFKVAEFLKSCDKVEDVIYPGLATHPQHGIAKKQARGFGGMISFRIRGDLKASTKLLENLKVFALAESLGAVESLAELPSIMTHAGLTAEEKQRLGVTDSLIRLSVGLEDAEDLIGDLKQALEKAFA